MGIFAAVAVFAAHGVFEAVFGEEAAVLIIEAEAEGGIVVLGAAAVVEIAAGCDHQREVKTTPFGGLVLQAGLAVGGISAEVFELHGKAGIGIGGFPLVEALGGAVERCGLVA